MATKLVRVLVALAVVAALVGAVGVASADMTVSPADTAETSQMVSTGDHMGAEMIEMMHEHMGDHEHGDHHDHEHGAHHGHEHADHHGHGSGNGHC